MKKNDLKKLALMGITGGIMMASQSSVEASSGSTVTNILAAKCGNSGSCGGATAANCGGRKSCGGATAARCGGSSRGNVSYQDPSQFNPQDNTPSQWSTDSQGAPSQYRRNPPQQSNSPSYQQQQNQSSQDNSYNPNQGDSSNASQGIQRNNTSYQQHSCKQYGNPSGNYGNTTYQQHSCGSPSGSQKGSTSYQQHSCGSPSASNNSFGNTANQQHSCGSPSQKSMSAQRSNPRNAYFADSDDDDSSNGGAAKKAPLTEEQFKAKLSTQGKADYDKLSPAGKAAAFKIASHDCAGKNDCKGQNACKTDKNECAGKGGCKGQSKCQATPDQAVKAASLKDKRTSLNLSPTKNNLR